MTIQEKIEQLKNNLSDNDVENIEEKEELETIIEEATKIFVMGDISRMDPILIKGIYDKWDALIDSKLQLFSTIKSM